MHKHITDPTERAIIRDLLDPTKPVADIIRTYRDVCSEQMIHFVGTEAGIDWDLRQRLQDALIQKEQLDALIVEMEATFFEQVKHPNDEFEERPVRYRPYSRLRRI